MFQQVENKETEVVVLLFLMVVLFSLLKAPVIQTVP